MTWRPLEMYEDACDDGECPPHCSPDDGVCERRGGPLAHCPLADVFALDLPGTVTLVKGLPTKRGGRSGSFYIDVSEMGASDCDMCGSPHMVFECPACGAEHNVFQGEDDSVGCWCGVTLHLSDVDQDAFAGMYGGFRC